ncbi:MAG TPA: hypothetical protein VMY34_11580 [Acidimicrobiales bacterium]|nr:hypothetical protein [Acidimicrobiales bacterium]
MAYGKVVLPRGAKMRRLPIGIGRGLRMEIDFAYQTRLYLGLYETELNGHLRHLATPGASSFDVGAQFGYDALVLAKLTGGRVRTFECDQHVMPSLRRNLEANPKHAARIEVVPLAVSATTDQKAGTITLDDACTTPPPVVHA